MIWVRRFISENGHYMIVLASVFLIGVSELWSGSQDKLMHLRMMDSTGRQFVLTYGTDPNATDGYDEAFGEVPLPLLPPVGDFELRFLDSPGHQRVPGGGAYIDVRAFRSTTQVDTFIIHFQTAVRAFPVTFSWDGISPRSCDSVCVLYRAGETNEIINMARQRALAIHDESVSNLMVIKYGAR